jgi:hypothetical protein
MKSFACRVRRYDTSESARAVLWAITRRDTPLGRNLEVRYCQQCDGFHLTRIRQRPTTHGVRNPDRNPTQADLFSDE